MIRRKTILVSSMALITASGIALIRVNTNKPPDQEIDQARKMLTEAELNGSSRFARENYQEALDFYDSAMAEWNRENERFILLRNYDRISDLAEKSSGCSQQAIENAKKKISETEIDLGKRIEALGIRIREFDEAYGSMPLGSKQREEMANCRLLYSEVELAYKNQNYSLCRSKLNKVETTFDQVFIPSIERFNSYLRDNPQWLGMVEESINHSRRTRSCIIIVDKLARELLIYKDGKMLNRFTMELGMNWMGDKQQKGDKSTPEGFYRIIDKKLKGQTLYHKAFLLDYPNDEDRRKFEANKKNGVIGQEAEIGGFIEIHGHGGKGIDWTDGCIALKNTDMDVAFRLCPIGTMVTIVGSTISFDEFRRTLK